MPERKSYPKSFKIQVVQECEQPGVSVAAIAMTHGINANVVRRWTHTFFRLPALFTTTECPAARLRFHGPLWPGLFPISI